MAERAGKADESVNEQDSTSASRRGSEQGVASAIAHPNIALVKYWGKAGGSRNVPAVPSISITLDALTTRTRVRFDASLGHDRVYFDGSELPVTSSEVERISRCLDEVRAVAGSEVPAEVTTRNDFPTGAGLASSASGFAALVVAAAAALELDLTPEHASRIARAASASAARSLFGGFVELPAGAADDDVAAHALASTDHWPLEVAVAICAEGPKATGSSLGMLSSARTSPFYRSWVDAAGADAETARDAIARRDFATLAACSEASCLKMHAVMQSSVPALIYWNSATMAALERIRELQAEGVEVFFTIDAGPQVKAVCAPGTGRRVADALAGVHGVSRVLHSSLGRAARTDSP